jgi:hypothetical protein
VADNLREISRPLTNEILKRITDARNCGVLEIHEAISKSDQHEKVEKLCHVEPGSPLRRRERLLHAKPT